MTPLQSACILVFAAAAAAATVAMMFQKVPMRAALYMLIVLAATAGIFISMNALLLGYLQLILYAGAVMVLFIAAINSLPAGGYTRTARSFAAYAAAGLAAALLLAALGRLAFRSGVNTMPAVEDIRGLAGALFGRYAFQSELVALLILAGVVGAVSAAKKEL